MSYQIARPHAEQASCKPDAVLRRLSHRLFKRALVVCIGALGLVGQSFVDHANAEVLHTYGNSLGHEVVNVIAVSASKLLSLVPPEYTIVPASSLLVGRPDQGIVTIANFQGINPTVDQRPSSRPTQVAIDVGILIIEPAEAAKAGVNIAGAFHIYALTIFTNDSQYAASLHTGDMPVDFVDAIGYQREMDDATGVGDLIVSVPAQHPTLYSINTGQGYAPAPGVFNAVFWNDGQRGTAVLNFIDQPFLQGNAISLIYTRPNSTLNALLDGGGLGPCSPDPQTGFNCVIAPSLNLRYDEGTVGKLQLIKPVRTGYRPFPHWLQM
jgi:hypothetical protein